MCCLRSIIKIGLKPKWLTEGEVGFACDIKVWEIFLSGYMGPYIFTQSNSPHYFRHGPILLCYKLALVCGPFIF
jgi:hypothetical protein